MRWADEIGNGLTFPVLADEGGQIANRYGVSGIPAYTLISRTMEYLVLNVNGGINPADIEEALDEEWPDVPWNEPPPLEPGDSADPVEGGGDGEGDVEGGGDVSFEAGPFGGGAAPADGAGVASPYGGCAASLVDSGSAPSPVWLALLLGAGLLGRRRR